MKEGPYLPSPLAPGHRSNGCCRRGHVLKGYNLLDNRNCRACQASFQWAKKRQLFNDDPRVVAHANDLYARYQERDEE
jgi:hypothetical protein